MINDTTLMPFRITATAALPAILSGVLPIQGLNAQMTTFRNYGAEAGVAVANAIAIDGNGALLVGTNDGLVRFDGFEFEPLLLPRLDHPRIARLSAATDGTLWGLTDSGALFHLGLYGDVSSVDVPAALRDDLSELRSFHRLRIDGRGRVWLNSANAGLWRFAPESGKWTRVETGSSPVVDFFVEGQVAVWVATRDRVARIPLTVETMSGVTWTAELPEVVFLRAHSAGQAWIGTRAGVWMLKADGRLDRVLDESFAAWWHAEPDTDSKGRLLFPVGHSRDQSRRLGVMRLGAAGAIELPPGFDDLTPRQLIFGREGDFWLAHAGGLIHVEQEYLVSYSLAAPDGTLEIAKQLIEDKGRGELWISTWGGMYRLREGGTERMSPLPRRATTHAVLGQDGSAWWTEHGGFAFAFREGRVTSTTGQTEHLIIVARNGVSFVAKPDGFYRKSGTQVSRISPRRFLAAPAAEGIGGRIWISPAFRGVDALEGDSLLSECQACGPMSVRSVVSALRNVEVVEMRADDRGRVWIAGGRSGLICLFQRGDTWVARRMSLADGLLSDEVHSVNPAREGRLWIGTPRGLQGFRVAPSGEPVLEPLFEFRARDGLIGEYVSTILEDGTGFLWVGTAPGLLHRLDYRAIPHLPSPAVRIARLETDGVPRQPGPLALRLRAAAGRLTIHLAPTTYRQVARLRFEYRLLPQDTAWIALVERSTQIASLSAGRHTLEARAVRPGEPPGPIIRQDFIGIAPFYRAWWFTPILASLLLLPFALWYHLRSMRRLTSERLRARIASDLHDDLGSGLTQISLYTELIRRASEPRVAALAEHVGEQARSLSDGMRDIIWALHPQHEDWQALELRMKDHAAAFLAPQGIALDFKGSEARERATLSVDVRRNVLLFFKEVLHNAARHSSCRRVQVRWHLTSRELRLVMTDDGTGFDAALVRPGNGLLNLRRRAADIDASIHLDTAPGRGTSVELRVSLEAHQRWRNYRSM